MKPQYSRSEFMNLAPTAASVAYLQWCARSGLMLQHLGHL